MHINWIQTERGKISHRKSSKKWRENNPEWIKKNRKEQYKEYKEYKKQLSEDDLKKVRKYQSEYRKRWLKTEKGKAFNQRLKITRRTREKNIINTLTAQEWVDILKEYKFRCAYCGKEFTLFDRETRDHVIPISKGGDNVKENIVPACQSCNSKKGDRIKEVI